MGPTLITTLSPTFMQVGDKVGQFGLRHVWLYAAKLGGELESKVGIQVGVQIVVLTSI